LFYHTTIQHILGVNMHHVEQFWIRNEHLQSFFHPWPNWHYTEVTIQLTWQVCPHEPCPSPMPIPHCLGQQTPLPWWPALHPMQILCRHTPTCASKHVPDNGNVQSWLPLGQNHEYWKQIGNELIKCQQALISLHVWAPSSLWRWHPWPQISIVLTPHTAPELNDKWTLTERPPSCHP
jgi:hypothetical protein